MSISYRDIPYRRGYKDGLTNKGKCFDSEYYISLPFAHGDYDAGYEVGRNNAKWMSYYGKTLDNECNAIGFASI